VCAALPGDPVEDHGLEMPPNRRVAPAGRNPTYQFAPPYGLRTTIRYNLHSVLFSYEQPELFDRINTIHWILVHPVDPVNPVKKNFLAKARC